MYSKSLPRRCMCGISQTSSDVILKRELPTSPRSSGRRAESRNGSVGRSQRVQRAASAAPWRYTRPTLVLVRGRLCRSPCSAAGKRCRSRRAPGLAWPGNELLFLAVRAHSPPAIRRRAIDAFVAAALAARSTLSALRDKRHRRFGILQPLRSRRTDERDDVVHHLCGCPAALPLPGPTCPS